MSVIRLKKITYEPHNWLHEAPMINGVWVYNQSDRKRHARRIKAIVDTGADVSMVPLSVLDSLGIDPREDGRAIEVLRGNGDVEIHPCHHVGFKICDKKISSEFAIAWNEDFILLGRDVLINSTLMVSWLGNKRGGWIEIAA